MPEALKPCPVLTLSPDELQKFQRTSPDELTTFLAALNYGPTKRLVSSFYLSPDKQTGIGTLLVTEEICRDHFGILRGVDSIEAIAQTAILHRHFRGSLKDAKPLFAGIHEARFLNIATVGAVLNIVVRDCFAEEGFGSYGWILRGKTVLTVGEIYGSVTDASKNLQDSLIKRANQLQQRELPLFAI